MRLVEIKKNNIGTGLLVESDGFISQSVGNNKKLCESVDLNSPDGLNLPNPFVVDAVFQKCGIENANGRIYPEEVLKPQVEKYLQKIAERRGYGEANHPESSSIDLDRIALNIIELHWEGQTLVGKIELPLSPGFRRYGLITCKADLLANWLLNNLKIGVSSRGVGSVEQKYGKYIVGDDFELICWDAVSDPSTPGAWIGKSAGELQQYVESIEKKEKLITEKLSRFDEWLSK